MRRFRLPKFSSDHGFEGVSFIADDGNADEEDHDDPSESFFPHHVKEKSRRLLGNRKGY